MPGRGARLWVSELCDSFCLGDYYNSVSNRCFSDNIRKVFLDKEETWSDISNQPRERTLELSLTRERETDLRAKQESFLPADIIAAPLGRSSRNHGSVLLGSKALD